jgi:hypothetical protein
MKQVASTNLTERLIVLAGKAIELTCEGHRDAKMLIELLGHLQAYKENKPHYPLSASARQCCGYPHYDDPKRPNFGSTQVRYLCQLYPGLRIRSHNTKGNSNGTACKVITYPYQENRYWMIKTEETEGIFKGIVRNYSLDDYHVTGRPAFGDSENWLGFEDEVPPTHCHH